MYVFGNNDSPDLPVLGVSWSDAVMFCNWQSWKLDLKPCYEISEWKPPEPPQNNQKFHDPYAVLPKHLRTPFAVNWRQDANGVRLPTPSEWEYACRALTTTKYSFGDEEIDLLKYGWFAANSTGRTHEVRAKLCNAWGLFDMHGNVWEWCGGPNSGSFRTTRGGGWDDAASDCQSWNGFETDSKMRDANLGFRVAVGPLSKAEVEGK